MKRLRRAAGHTPTAMRPKGAGYSNEDTAGHPLLARTRLGAAPHTMVWLVLAPGATTTVRLGTTLPNPDPPTPSPLTSIGIRRDVGPHTMVPCHLQWYGRAWHWRGKGGAPRCLHWYCWATGTGKYTAGRGGAYNVKYFVLFVEFFEDAPALRLHRRAKPRCSAAVDSHV